MKVISALFIAFRIRVRNTLSKLNASLSRVEEHQLAQQRTLDDLTQSAAVGRQNENEILRLLREIHADYPEFKKQTEKRLADIERVLPKN